MKTLTKYIVAAIITLGILPILPPKYTYLFVGLLGLYWAVRFRHIGRSAVEERKKLPKFINFYYKYSDSDIIFFQIMFLLFGILAFIVGFAKFLSN